MDMTCHTGSNFFRAEDIEPGVRIETKIVSVVLREFEDGPKPVVYTDYQAKGVVLNPTRTKVLYAAFGPESNNWLDRPIVVFRDETTYAGKKVACVAIEAMGAQRIATQPRPRPVISSGRSARLKSVEPPKPPEPPPVDKCDGPSDGPADPEDDIPF
jgi:hypothetical protein